ncbi:MAG: DegQ family serine endoprotease [Rhodospirillum sp.]|nr:DegQ family serine endoprotease [Rhodospirillum sp.]MCF8491826.1 DegQ family serine endoprotease [Rhodospirillum sp.]MCF8500519.1 DegQ family serine endoprotease [Rhodospirillum sp.]
MIAPVLMAGVLIAVPVVAGLSPVSDAQARETPESFADLAEALLPAVVNISTTQTIDSSRGPDMPQFPPGSPFEEFFKDFFDKHGGPNGGGGQPRKATSLGSGFVIDKTGYIVTNNHVIKDADEITVILQDDTALKAELIGHDEKTDVALLKVEPKEPLAAAVPWGDSDAARVGDWVVAIGNPFGLGGTVTAGIISAKTRDINAGPYDSFIQTDASINKGNSGGPLFNEDGQVIGINTAIFSPSGGSIGIGFAVPSNLAKQVVAQLKEYGRTKRGWIGVRIQSVGEEIADGLGLDKPRGALVAAVTPEGPAAAAGIKAGDVILSFDGRPVPEMRELPRIVAETTIDKDVDVMVWREGKEVDLKMAVGELEVAEEKGLLDDETKTAETEDGSTQIAPLGLGVASLDDKLRSTYGLGQDSTGVVITAVKEDSDAASKGLEPGVVIIKVNQQEVGTPEEVANAVAEAIEQDRKTVLLLVEGKGARTFIPLKIKDQ